MFSVSIISGFQFIIKYNTVLDFVCICRYMCWLHWSVVDLGHVGCDSGEIDTVCYWWKYSNIWRWYAYRRISNICTELWDLNLPSSVCITKHFPLCLHGSPTKIATHTGIVTLELGIPFHKFTWCEKTQIDLFCYCSHFICKRSSACIQFRNM